MRFVLTLVVLAFASVCSAQITVSDRLPPPVKYPAEVYTMTDAQFYEWATRYNQAQLDAWDKRKAEIKEPEFIDGVESVDETEYTGYGHRSDLYFSRRGHTGVVTRHSVSFPSRRPNPWYVNPGPLAGVNPYVRPTWPVVEYLGSGHE